MPSILHQVCLITVSALALLYFATLLVMWYCIIFSTDRWPVNVPNPKLPYLRGRQVSVAISISAQCTSQDPEFLKHLLLGTQRNPEHGSSQKMLPTYPPVRDYITCLRNLCTLIHVCDYRYFLVDDPVRNCRSVATFRRHLKSRLIFSPNPASPADYLT